MTLAGFCSGACQFESDLVANLEDRFSHDGAYRTNGFVQDARTEQIPGVN